MSLPAREKNHIFNLTKNILREVVSTRDALGRRLNFSLADRVVVGREDKILSKRGGREAGF